MALNNLAMLLEGRGDHGGAEPLLREALAVGRRVIGPSDPSNAEVIASVITNLAGVLAVRGDYVSAEPLYREALEIRRRILGPEHLDYAASLDHLSAYLRDRADYAAAEPLAREAVEVRHRVQGIDHPEYAASLNNLARILRSKGDYAAAESLYRDALEIRRRVLGTDHPDYASAAHNMGVMLYEKGDYAAAEPLYREALEVRRRILGPDHPRYATTLSALGALYFAKGDYAAAEPLLRAALEIESRAHGRNHPDYASILGNLAAVLRAKGDYTAAAPLYREALEIRRQTLGSDHPEYATAANNFALLLNHTGNYAAAESLFRDAAEVWRRALGPNHPSYAIALNNLATLLEDKGDFAAAEPLLAEATRITARALGEDHPDYAIRLGNLASLNFKLGRPDSALRLMERALGVDQRVLTRVFGFTSERGMLAYAATLHPSLSGLLTMATLQRSDAATEAALRWVLLRKGAVLSAMSAYRDAERLAAADPQVRTGLARLRTTREQLSRIALNPPNGVASDSLARLVAVMSSERERLETVLARTLSTRLQGREMVAGAIELESVRRALHAGSALVEFVRYDNMDLGARGRPRRRPEVRYAALVLRPAGPVELIELGEAQEIEEAIARVRAAHMEGRDEGSYRAAAQELHALVFAPLEAALGDAERLMLSPDGELNRVPFAALVDQKGRYLLARYQLEYVSSGRDLLRAPSTTRGAGTVIFAAPLFDAAATQPSAGAGASPAGAARRNAPSAGAAPAARTTVVDSAAPGVAVQVVGTLRGLKWEPLPGAAAEAADVRRALAAPAWGPLRLHVGAEAREAALKSVHSPRLLHVATHGFFVPARQLTAEERARCLEGGAENTLAEANGMGRGIERLRCAEDPLLRSGLVLSGANAGGAPGPDGEDGWVLAEEIAAMELAGTELVVLSACETGLGDVQVGEGVYGLRRAFELAGARQILMSLYKVPDTATRELLAGFYRRLARGASAEEALRASQLELQKKKPHPLNWGSFVLVGSGGEKPGAARR